MTATNDDSQTPRDDASGAARDSAPGPVSTSVEQRLVAVGDVKIDLNASALHSLPPPLPTPVPTSSNVPEMPAASPPAADIKKSTRRRLPSIALVSLVLMGAGIAGVMVKLEIAPTQISRAVFRFVNKARSPATGSVIEVNAELSSSGDATRCIVAHFPVNTFAESANLSFVCSEADAWTITPQLRKAIVANGVSAGAEMWGYLGPFELAGAISLRAMCCTTVSPVTAAVPETDCGSLSDTLNSLGPQITAAQLASYEQMVKCLLDRKVRLPPHFTGVADKPMRAAVARFFNLPAGNLPAGNLPAGNLPAGVP